MKIHLKLNTSQNKQSRKVFLKIYGTETSNGEESSEIIDIFNTEIIQVSKIEKVLKDSELADIKKYQKKDHTCQEIKNKINNRDNCDKKVYKNFRVYENILYRKRNRRHFDNHEFQVVLPVKLINTVFDRYHNDRSIGGHMGCNKTEEKIQNHFL